MSPPIRYVCFDLGGVIVKHHRSWAEACAARGIDVRPGIEHPERVERRRALNTAFQCGHFPAPEFYRRLTETTDGLYTQDEVTDLHEHWVYAEYDGIADVLRRLRQNPSVRTGALSNTNERHWMDMVTGRDGRPPRFPAATILHEQHASHVLGLCKPDPRIYEALERLSACRPSEILFFDDLERNTAAAAARGWRTHVVDHTGDTAAQVEAALVAHGLLSPRTLRA